MSTQQRKRIRTTSTSGYLDYGLYFKARWLLRSQDQAGLGLHGTPLSRSHRGGIIALVLGRAKQRFATTGSSEGGGFE